MKVRIKKLNDDAIPPKYAHEGDAGMDLYSRETMILKAGTRHLFKTGISMEIPEGYVGLFWDKSGLAFKNGITVLGGVIDSGYRGEFGVILLNTGEDDYEIKKGDKIAQVLIQPVVNAELEVVEELDNTKRGDGGFGSTGRN